MKSQNKFPKNNIIDEWLENYVMQKNGIKSFLVSVILGLLAVVLLVSMTSCGARRVNKSNTETKETTKTQIAISDNSKIVTDLSTNTKTTVTTEINEQIGEVIETTIEEPVNPKLPASVIDEKGNKVELNNTKRTKSKRTVLSDKKTLNNKVVDNSIKVAKTEQKDVKTDIKSDNSKVSKSNVKNIDKKGFNFLSLWWLLLLIPAYLLWRKYFC